MVKKKWWGADSFRGRVLSRGKGEIFEQGLGKIGASAGAGRDDRYGMVTESAGVTTSRRSYS